MFFHRKDLEEIINSLKGDIIKKITERKKIENLQNFADLKSDVNIFMIKNIQTQINKICNIIYQLKQFIRINKDISPNIDTYRLNIYLTPIFPIDDQKIHKMNKILIKKLEKKNETK